MELIDVRPQQLVAVEARNVFSEIGFSIAHHFQHCLIHIDNVVVHICDHDIVLTIVESRPNTQILCRIRSCERDVLPLDNGPIALTVLVK